MPTAYDPLVSKVIAWAPDRPGAIARMVRALTEYDLRGISTTIGFCRDLVRSPEFAAAEFDTTYVDRLLEQNGRTGATSGEMEEIAAIAAAMWAMASTSIVHRQRPHCDRRSTTDSLWSRACTAGVVAVNVDVMVNGRQWKVALEPAEQAGPVHRHDQGQAPQRRCVVDRRRHIVAHRRRRDV